MSLIRPAFVGLILLSAVGCASSPGPAGSTRGSAGGATADDGAAKTIVVAQINALKLIGVWEFSNTNGGGASLVEVHTNGLVSLGKKGAMEGRLAAGIPSLDDGSIVFLPDGRLQTTWKLRPNVTWQDGAPFTADDVIFSQAVLTQPELRSSITGVSPYIDRMDAPDPLTLLITWKTPYYNALFLDIRSMWLFPKHLLAEPFEGDKEVFLALPYFTTDYVHLGPFRLVDWGMGQNMIFERFDNYFLGRPKVGKINIRVIQDTNTMLANMKAGELDIITEKALPSNASVDLRDEWNRTAGGTVLGRQENWWYAWWQFDQQFARPLEISQDVRIRRGLLHGVDREALREFVLPGLPNTSGDTFMTATDPRAAIVGQPFARYTYDPARASQELADAGWRRAADGRVLNTAGEQVQFELRTTSAQANVIPVVAADWRKLGLDVAEFIPPPQLGRDNEEKAKFPAFELRARSQNEAVFSSFDSREAAYPANRFQGANSAHYASPILDRMIDRLYTTLDPMDRGLILKDMGEFMATELPALPFYYTINFLHLRNTVRGPFEDYESSGTTVPNAVHLWERI